MESSAPSSPPAKAPMGKKRMWMIVAVIAVVVVVVAAILIMTMGGGDDGDSGGNGIAPTKGEFAAGNSLMYQMEVSGGGISMVTTTWMNITAVDATGYDMLVTTDMMGFSFNETNHYNKTDMIGPDATLPANATDLGVTSISTGVGQRQVHHYRYTDEGNTVDMYTGVSNGVMYKMVFSGEGTGEMKLKSSNISWV